MTNVTYSPTDGHTNFAEVRTYVGETIAQKLMSSFGGVRIYIPSPARLRDDDTIVLILGRPDAEHLAAMFKGANVDIPMGANSGVFERRREFLKRHNAGEGVVEIALAMHVTERTVRRWLVKEGIKLGLESRSMKRHVPELCRRYRAGETPAGIALAMRLTERTVRRWLVKEGLISAREQSSTKALTMLQHPPTAASAT